VQVSTFLEIYILSVAFLSHYPGVFLGINCICFDIISYILFCATLFPYPVLFFSFFCVISSTAHHFFFELTVPLPPSPIYFPPSSFHPSPLPSPLSLPSFIAGQLTRLSWLLIEQWLLCHRIRHVRPPRISALFLLLVKSRQRGLFFWTGRRLMV